MQGIRDDYRPQLSIFAQEEKERRATAAAQVQRTEEPQEALTRISKRYRQYLLPAIEAFLQEFKAKSAAEYAFLEQKFSGGPGKRLCPRAVCRPRLERADALE